MRGIAKYVMTGRLQAIIVAVLIGAVPPFNIVSPAVVALVILRKGIQEGTPVLLFALLPPVLWMMFGLGEPLILVMMLTVAALAAMLRETESWELTLLLSVGTGVVIELFLRTQPGIIDFYLNQMVQIQAVAGLNATEFPVQREQLPGAFGAIGVLVSLLLLMLARSLQAGLYNPGGFRKEFHSLILSAKSAIGLVVIMLLPSLGLAPESWGVYAAIPLLIAGLALIHGIVGRRGLSSTWITATYVVLLFLAPLLGMLVVAAVMDSRFDFRKLKD